MGCSEPIVCQVHSLWRHQGTFTPQPLRLVALLLVATNRPICLRAVLNPHVVQSMDRKPHGTYEPLLLDDFY